MAQEVWIALWLSFGQLKADVPELMQRGGMKRLTRSVLVDLYRRTDPEDERLTPVPIQTMPDTSIDLAEDM